MEGILVLVIAMLGGLLLGALAFVRVGHWLFDLLRARERVPARRATALMREAIFASGPWVLIAATLLGLQIRTQPWAIWSYTGFGVAVAFFAAVCIAVDRLARSHTA